MIASTLNSTILIEFPEWIDSIFNIWLTFLAVINIPAHLLLIFLVLFRTPKEMTVYRYTVSNTTCWSLMFIIHETCFYRAVPLFPFLAGKVNGVLGRLGDFHGGYVQFIVLATLVFNLLISGVFCFLTQYFSIAQHSIYQNIRFYRHGVPAFISFHVIGFFLPIFIAINSYTPSSEVRRQIIRSHSNLAEYLSHNDLIIFGFDEQFNPYFKVLVYLACSIIILIIILIGLLLFHMTLTLRKLKKSSLDSHHFKAKIVILVITRTLTPFITGILPTILSVVVAVIWPDSSYIVGSFLMMITFTVGFWTCVATIVVFKPFRDALKELVNNPRMFFKKKRPSLFDRIMKNLNLDKIVLMNKNMVLSKERNILFEKSSTVIPISNPNRRGSSTLGLSKPQNDIH